MADTSLVDRHEPLWKRLPVVVQLRRSTGWQRAMLITGVVICALYLIVALAAPLIAPYGFGQLQGADGQGFPRTAPPSAEHVWGTTVGGFDVFSRVVFGARTAVPIVISGGNSSYTGGIVAAAISITVVYVPQYFRVVRAEAVRLKNEAFVESARVIGTNPWRIMTRHVLRNSTRSLPLILTLNASDAILTLAGLGFLGFGIGPTSGAEWGYDLSRALSDVASGVWWTGVFPGVAIVVLVLGVTFIGESLNDISDPRLRARRRLKQLVSRKQAASTEGATA
jgi:peptide/nickel transport system permease protein